MKEIKDYLHLYLGCDCKVPGTIIKLTPEVLATWDFSHHGLKPILRPLSSMGEEEKKDSEQLWFDNIEKFGRGAELYAIMTKYFLYHQFDLFGLIEAGLAIDKTTLEK